MINDVSHDISELVTAYNDAWTALTAYDADALPTTGITQGGAELSGKQLMDALGDFKAALVGSGHAAEHFGNERTTGAVQGIVGNITQSIDGKPVYPTFEEQAAHLFYFMVKDHPFVDGNKRSGAFSFIWYLHRAGILNRAAMPTPALTALTLFIAESDAAQKDKVVRLILQLLRP